MLERKQQVLELALSALEKELKQEPISPERVTALTDTIKVLDEATPLLQR